MKWICLLMILAVILTIVGWIVSHLFIVCIEGRPQPYRDMKEQAEKAIKDVGGADALEKEAKVILSNFRDGSDWESILDNEKNCPAITKLYSLLSPYGHDPWVVADSEDLPAHVVIRFGSHAYYAYIWIFDSAHVPLGKIEGVENLTGAVYLSQKNE